MFGNVSLMHLNSLSPRRGLLKPVLAPVCFGLLSVLTIFSDCSYPDLLSWKSFESSRYRTCELWVVSRSCWPLVHDWLQRNGREASQAPRVEISGLSAENDRWPGRLAWHGLGHGRRSARGHRRVQLRTLQPPGFDLGLGRGPRHRDLRDGHHLLRDSESHKVGSRW